MEKVNASKVKKATDFLEKWKKFQEEKDQKRKPLANKSLPQLTQDKNEPKKTEKRIITSRYLKQKSENNALKQPTAPTKDHSTQKRISILPPTRTEGTPMSIRLERWKKQKENQKQNKFTTNSVRKKTQTPLKANQKYVHVKSKLMIASSQKCAENQRNNQKRDTVKRILSSTLKPDTVKMASSNKLPGGIARGSSESASHVRKSLSTPAAGVLTKNKQRAPPKNKLSQIQHKKVSESMNKRRHSDTGSRGVQATRSILKRKSCLPSLSHEMESPKTDVGTLKTPGHNVRFITPVLCKPDNQSFRKTPVRLAPRSMRSELEEWLEKRGKTPSGFRHLRCFDASLSAKKKSGDTVHKQDDKAPQSLVVLNLENQFTTDDSLNTAEDLTGEDLDSMLEECSTLYEAGCPLEDTMKWLDSIEENIDIARSSARFYICKAKILKSTDNLEEVLHVFEKAVKSCAQPADELASSLTQIITEISLERERKARLRSALAKEMNDGNVFPSSTVKYCVRQLTPHKNRKRQSSGAHDNLGPSPCKVVTPVRRSTRRSLCSLPEQFHNYSPVYTALEDIPSPERRSTFFQSNPALELLLEDDHV